MLVGLDASPDFLSGFPGAFPCLMVCPGSFGFGAESVPSGPSFSSFSLISVRGTPKRLKEYLSSFIFDFLVSLQLLFQVPGMLLDIAHFNSLFVIFVEHLFQQVDDLG